MGCRKHHNTAIIVFIPDSHRPRHTPRLHVQWTTVPVNINSSMRLALNV
jgi:hypothetical protein